MKVGFRVILALVVAALAAGCWDASPTRPRGLPPIERNEPQPGDPPVVWVSGTLDSVSDEALLVRDEEGPRVHVERFAAGATRFLRPRAGEWRELTARKVSALESGDLVCVEAILDSGAFLAVRVFLGAECGPAP